VQSTILVPVNGPVEKNGNGRFSKMPFLRNPNVDHSTFCLYNLFFEENLKKVSEKLLETK